MAAAARAASPRDGMGSSPSPPSKRKSGSEATLANAARAAEQKRMRNPSGAAGSPANKDTRISAFAVRNVDLLVPAKELGDKHRIKGVVALLEDLTRADASQPGTHTWGEMEFDELECVPYEAHPTPACDLLKSPTSYLADIHEAPEQSL